MFMTWLLLIPQNLLRIYNPNILVHAFALSRNWFKLLQIFRSLHKILLNVGRSAYERKLITFTCSEAGSNCSNTELGIISPPYVTIVMVSSTGEWARINLINSHSWFVLSKPLIFTTLSLLKYKSTRHSALWKSRKENLLTWNSQQNIVIRKSNS